MSLQARTPRSSRPPTTPTPWGSFGTSNLDFPDRKNTNLMCVRLCTATTSSETGQMAPVEISSKSTNWETARGWRWFYGEIQFEIAFINLFLWFHEKRHSFAIISVWTKYYVFCHSVEKREEEFTHQKLFREIISSVTYLVKPISRNFCESGFFENQLCQY